MILHNAQNVIKICKKHVMIDRRIESERRKLRKLFIGYCTWIS